MARNRFFPLIPIPEEITDEAKISDCKFVQDRGAGLMEAIGSKIDLETMQGQMLIGAIAVAVDSAYRKIGELVIKELAEEKIVGTRQSGENRGADSHLDAALRSMGLGALE